MSKFITVIQLPEVRSKQNALVPTVDRVHTFSLFSLLARKTVQYHPVHAVCVSVPNSLIEFLDKLRINIEPLKTTPSHYSSGSYHHERQHGGYNNFEN
jgi:hypothetical protein